MSSNPELVRQAQDNTIQSSKHPTEQANPRAPFLGLPFLAAANTISPAWWSPQRDVYLRRLWRESDHLAGAMYAMQSRISSTPFIVLPRDPSFARYKREAAVYTEKLNDYSAFGEGWSMLMNPFLEDVFGQDNGGFIEVIGEGRKDGPLTGPVITLAHLDSALCTRTSNPEFPVIYRDEANGSYHKIHYTRIISIAQQPSSNHAMNGVGLCALSRCLNTGQHLLDILVNLQEQMGSRPMRGILTTKGGLSPLDIQDAFEIVNSTLDASGNTRYSGIAVVGDPTMPSAGIELTALAGLPQGFDIEVSYQTGMSIVALAFGIDPRELYPNLGTGSTRAEALLQHIKQRYKAIGQTLSSLERAINHKVLPPHLKIEFRFQDDAQDRQEAEIESLRVNTRRIAVQNNLIDISIARSEMKERGELTESEFEILEAKDGRLLDGTPIVRLFVSPDPEMRAMLDIGIDNPLDYYANEPEKVLQAIRQCEIRLMPQMGRGSEIQQRETKLAMYALQALRKEYEKHKIAEMAEMAAQEEIEEASLDADGLRSDPMGGNVQLGAQRTPNAGNDMDTLSDQITLQAALKAKNDFVVSPELGIHIIEFPDWLDGISGELVKSVMPVGLLAKANLGLKDNEAEYLLKVLELLKDVSERVVRPT